MVQVFIEDLFAEEAKERAAGDYSYLALQEMDDSRKYNIQYKTSDDYTIGVDKTGNPNLAGTKQEAWYRMNKDGKKEYIDTNTALHIIEQDKAQDQLFSSLVSRHLNINGDIIDEKALDDDIKTWATVITNNIYSDTPILDPATMFTADKNKVPKAVYEKMSEAEKIYYAILNRFKLLEQ